LSECIFGIDELKKILSAEKYEMYKDFRVNVLDTAINEINAYGDILITYTVEKKGRKVDKIIFTIKQKKGVKERVDTFKKIEQRLNPNQIPGQQNMFTDDIENNK
jgi:plasmid replication initiation protein